MSLSAGDKLGPYQILAPIGAGGMGKVYRAKDPRLNRDVAIKVSGSQFSERFERVDHWERIASRWRPAFSSHL